MVSSHGIKRIPESPYKGEFENRFYPYAIQYQLEHDFNHKILLGTISLETHYGEKILDVIYKGERICSSNLFNIKSFGGWEGKRGYALVEEHHGTNIVMVKQWFRIYDTIQESFDDYIKLVSDPEKRYIEAWEYRHNPEVYTKMIDELGYATFPNYGKIIMSRIRRLE